MFKLAIFFLTNTVLCEALLLCLINIGKEDKIYVHYLPIISISLGILSGIVDG